VPPASQSGEAGINPGISGAGASRPLEVLRRLLLLLGALASLWAIVKPIDAVFRVRTVDFAKLQKQDGRRMQSDIRMMSRVSGLTIDPNDPTINSAPTLTLAQYVAKQTKDRLVPVAGNEWSAFFDGVQQTLAGKSTTFARHLNVGSGLYLLYFPTETAPLRELRGQLGDTKEFSYVALRDGDGVRYLEVLFQRPSSALSDAPNWLLYPLRRHAVWWFIAGLLAYAAIPWHRKGPAELRYSTGRAMVGPDMLGLFLLVAFVMLPILVITANARGSGPLDVFGFSTDWWPLTLVMWLMAGGGLAMGFVALRYACFSLWISPAGLRRKTLFSDGDYAFADMVAVEPAHWAWPAWLRIVAILIGMLNWRLLGPVLIGSSEEAFGIAIRFKDGRKLKLWFTYLPGFARVFRALRQANVPLDPELVRIIDEDIASTEPELKPGRRGKIAAGILLTLAVAGALTWQYWPAKTRVVKHELTYTYEALAQRMALTKEMEGVLRQMQQALDLPKDATSQQRVAAMRTFEALQQQHDELEKRYNAIQPTIED